ncbi:hypothetical protein EW145_g3744 [Phellinidium pouzarii]|uniref:Uncharacterized protein n=1 Tax=Phellinidium pouzarii TaxID=167371 RepID=A0A4S4L7W2_9AGAM|nr:hypothetical protein EW145_g3744 [Phellinidium pouzarii]
MLAKLALRRASPLTRAASSQARGLQAILQKSPNDVVITFASRTAMGKYRSGQLKDHPVDEILLALFKATLAKTKLDPSKIDDICVGTCHPPSPLYISRAAAIASGIPANVPIYTVNRLCSSGLMAVRNIAHDIQTGEASVGVAVGVESMTQNPRPSPEIREGVSSHPQSHDCVQPMGWTSERVAQDFKVSREKQDKYALISHSRAEKAQAKGIFNDEIIPIEIGGQKIYKDDTIRPGVTAESLAKLKPVFPDWGDGLTTAGNASGIGDGAALCILTTRERAEKDGMDILGKWVGSSVVGVEPCHMGIGPVPAIQKVLAHTGLKKDDVDVWEINEAFASQFAYCVEELKIPIEKLNINGGAIALTHPLGMTGTRQIVTGLSQLRRQNGQVLCTSMCIGSGMGAAAIFVNEAQLIRIYVDSTILSALLKYSVLATAIGIYKDDSKYRSEVQLAIVDLLNPFHRNTYYIMLSLLIPIVVSCAVFSAHAMSRTSPPPGAIVVRMATTASGEFTSIASAIASLPDDASSQSIFVFPGTYTERVLIDRPGAVSVYGYTMNTMSYSMNQVVLTHSASLGTAGSDDASGTLRIKSDNVALYNIDVRNDFGVSETNGQAIALSNYGSNFGAYACGFVSYQDTLYSNLGTQVYLMSYIEVGSAQESPVACLLYIHLNKGAVDFIFGRQGQAYFERNTIASKGAGCITASGRESNDSSIYIFEQNNVIAALDAFSNVTGNVYLGRPWGDYARVILKNTTVGLQLNKAVWSEWNSGDPRTDNILFAEYDSTGFGVANASRPSFATVLTGEEAAEYTISTAVGNNYTDWVDADYLA